MVMPSFGDRERSLHGSSKVLLIISPPPWLSRSDASLEQWCDSGGVFAHSHISPQVKLLPSLRGPALPPGADLVTMMGGVSRIYTADLCCCEDAPLCHKGLANTGASFIPVSILLLFLLPASFFIPSLHPCALCPWLPSWADCTCCSLLDLSWGVTVGALPLIQRRPGLDLERARGLL